MSVSRESWYREAEIPERERLFQELRRTHSTSVAIRLLQLLHRSGQAGSVPEVLRELSLEQVHEIPEELLPKVVFTETYMYFGDGHYTGDMILSQGYVGPKGFVPQGEGYRELGSRLQDDEVGYEGEVAYEPTSFPEVPKEQVLQTLPLLDFLQKVEVERWSWDADGHLELRGSLADPPESWPRSGHPYTFEQSYWDDQGEFSASLHFEDPKVEETVRDLTVPLRVASSHSLVSVREQDERRLIQRFERGDAGALHELGILYTRTQHLPSLTKEGWDKALTVLEGLISEGQEVPPLHEGYFWEFLWKAVDEARRIPRIDIVYTLNHEADTRESVEFGDVPYSTEFKTKRDPLPEFVQFLRKKGFHFEHADASNIHLYQDLSQREARRIPELRALAAGREPIIQGRTNLFVEANEQEYPDLVDFVGDRILQWLGKP